MEYLRFYSLTFSEFGLHASVHPYFFVAHHLHRSKKQEESPIFLSLQRMKTVCRLILCITTLLVTENSSAQIGVHGPRIISAANTIVNEYTYLTANATAGSTSITVNNNNLNTNSRFTSPLAQGDLIMIIQMQGVSTNVTTTGPFTLPLDNTWGAITAYNNCGNYEFAQVSSVAGGATINILCGLKNNYTSAGHVQVIRVPRYTTLTINSSLTAEIWDGNKGGIVSVEVQGLTSFGAGGSINVNALGFRPGTCSENSAYFGAGQFGANDGGEGAEKGESVWGFTTEYTPMNSLFCRGAPANGGGGGNGHNCGGGGGGNAGNTAAYTGYGVSNAAFNASWIMETPSLVGSVSSGGGRGGNSLSSSNQNATVVAPGNALWAGDNNRNFGGLGGRPLDYSTGRLFIGGGGGAGDQNDGDGGGGGRGAGMVFIMSYNNVSGSGVITANGANGISSLNAGFGFNGVDGAGGGGAGGTVVVNANGTVSGITINANGGTGGNQNKPIPANDAYGPGGGGGGGYIAVSAGAPTRTATGGANGTTNSTAFLEFPPKGATSGGTGLPTEVFSNYYFTLANQTICYNTTATLTATITGTVPGGTTLNWYATEFGTVSLGTGTTFTTPALTTTTTYYVGFCPGWYRLPVTVTVNPQIVINTAALVLTNETCAGNDGSVTGITASGGTGALSYSWSPSGGSAANATGLTAGSYTLTVTDATSCTATSGPHVITNTGGPVINTSAIVITNATCGLNNGSISGITVSGGTGALSYTWNAVPAGGPSISGSAPGSFTLVVTDGIGCSSTAGPFVITNVGGVTINAAGVVLANNTCGLSNGSITGITASSPSGGLIYAWSPSGGSAANATGLTGNAYTLTVTDATGCSATSGPHTILDQPGPTINSTGVVLTNESCVGNDGSITGLTVSGGTGTLDLAWNAVITGSASATGLTGGSYTFTATDDNGCVATAGPFVLTTTTGPSVNTTAIVLNNPTCGNANGSITGIVASGGSGTLTFDWSGTAFPTEDLTGAAPGSFMLTVTDAAGCTATAGPFVLTNVGGVTINTTGVTITDASCGSATGSITGITASSPAGGLTYDWSGTATPSADLTAVIGGAYMLTVTDAAGCTSTAGPFTILNVGAPVIDTSAITVSGTTCGLNNGSIAGITVTGGSGTLTYDWNGTASVDQNLSGAASGAYTLTVTDATGCTAIMGPVNIATSNILAAAATGTNVSCFGLSDGSTVGGFAGGNGGETYQWIGGPATQNYNGIPAGTYQVIVTDIQGCSDTASITITEPASFNPTITGTATICEGTSTTLTATGGGTYSWSSGGGAAAETVSPTITTTYIVTVTNGACSETDSFTVTVNPLPVATITGTLIICDGQSTTLTAGGGSAYVWDDSSTGTSITVSPTTNTNYFVIATNSCGSDTAFATVSVGAAFTTDAGPDQTIGLGNTTTISATGGVSFVWTPATALGCSTCQTTSASPTSTTTYTVTATNAFGCTTTDDVTIIIDDTEILFVPDIFAPNGNGVNDILFVRGSGISSLTFRVFDRWGQKVFETTDLTLGWDGTYRGKPLDTGVFVYTLEGAFYSGTEFSQKGNVTLKR
jgi:gliding motility-associated-like protein